MPCFESSGSSDKNDDAPVAGLHTRASNSAEFLPLPLLLVLEGGEGKTFSSFTSSFPIIVSMENFEISLVAFL